MKVPLAAVQLKDGEDTVSPEAGETVSVVMEGVVESINGDTITLAPSTANGVELEAAAPEEAPEVSEREELFAQMEAQDNERNLI